MGDEWTEHRVVTLHGEQVYYQHDCCNALVTVRYPYCPHCGKPMRKEGKSEKGTDDIR